MAFETLKIEGRNTRILCPEINADLFFLHADISEGISQLVTIEAEFLTDVRDLDSEKFLAEEIIIVMEVEDETVRAWKGLCIECLYIGESTGMGHGTYAHYRIQARSWPWMLTRTTDCRIFQNLKTEDIIKQVFGDAGFADYRFKLNGNYQEREYCVQYRESDFDFISRLMEDEGMFYRFEHDWEASSEDDKQTKVWMEIMDDSSQTDQIWGDFNIRLLDKESGQREEKDFIHKWEERKSFDTGLVTLRDYDFTKPKADLTGTRKVTKKKYSDYEHYDYPGRYEEQERGTQIAARKLEAITAERYQVRGQGLFKQLEPGKRFGLVDHPNDTQNADYLAVRMIHKLKQEKTDSKAIKRPEDFRFSEEDIIEAHEVTFVAQPVDVPFKPKEVTPWPSIAGVQTAVVVGPSDEEIYTDEFGRIKIQFHWDREGKDDDKSSCWVRVMTPMSGKNWGMLSIPRIGQEVVVQFEEGDPDRPLVVGMIYNADNTVPMSQPGNKTQIGFRTDCHKNDDGEAFHEFILEDNKDSEFIRMVSEKDYYVTVKNNTVITYGTGDKDEGTLKLDVWKQTTETFGVASGEGGLEQEVQDDFKKTVWKGDYLLDVMEGDRKTFIKCDEILKIDGDRKTNIKKDEILDIKEDRKTTVVMDDILEVKEDRKTEVGGNQELEVKGKRETTIKKDDGLEVKGKREAKVNKNDELKVTGDRLVTVKKNIKSVATKSILERATKMIMLKADTKIVLQCGASKIVMSPTGIKITAPTVEVKATAKADISSPMTTIKGDAIMTVKGGLVMIN